MTTGNPGRFSVEAERAAKTLHEDIQKLMVSTANAMRRNEPADLFSVAKRAEEVVLSTYALTHLLRAIRSQALKLRREIQDASAPNHR